MSETEINDGFQEESTTPDPNQALIDELVANARIAADIHYAALFEAFQAAVPKWLHRTGEFAPTAERPKAFTSESTSNYFWVGLDMHKYGPIAAQFKFRDSKWKFFGYSVQLMNTPFQWRCRSSARSERLSSLL